MQSELPVDAAQVVLHRPGRQEQRLRDLAVAPPRGDRLGHGPLLRRQALQPGGRRRLAAGGTRARYCVRASQGCAPSVSNARCAATAGRRGPPTAAGRGAGARRGAAACGPPRTDRAPRHGPRAPRAGASPHGRLRHQRPHAQVEARASGSSMAASSGLRDAAREPGIRQVALAHQRLDEVDPRGQHAIAQAAAEEVDVGGRLERVAASSRRPCASARIPTARSRVASRRRSPMRRACARMRATSFARAVSRPAGRRARRQRGHAELGAGRPCDGGDRPAGSSMSRARTQSPAARARHARMPERQAREAVRSACRWTATSRRSADSGRVQEQVVEEDDAEQAVERQPGSSVASRLGNGAAAHRVADGDLARLEQAGRHRAVRSTVARRHRCWAERALDLHELPGGAQARIDVTQAPRVHGGVPQQRPQRVRGGDARASNRGPLGRQCAPGSASERCNVLSHSTHRAHSASSCSSASRSSSASVPA